MTTFCNAGQLTGTVLIEGTEYTTNNPPITITTGTGWLGRFWFQEPGSSVQGDIVTYFSANQLTFNTNYYPVNGGNIYECQILEDGVVVASAEVFITPENDFVNASVALVSSHTLVTDSIGNVLYYSDSDVVYDVTCDDEEEEEEEEECNGITSPGQIVTLNWVSGSPPSTPSLIMSYWRDVEVSDSGTSTRTWTGTGCYPKSAPTGNPDDAQPTNTPDSPSPSNPPQPQPPPPPPPDNPPPPNSNPPPLPPNSNPPPPPPFNDESPEPIPFAPTIPPAFSPIDLSFNTGTPQVFYPRIAINLIGGTIQFTSWTGYGITISDIGSYVVGTAFPSAYTSPMLSLSSLSNLKRLTHVTLQFDNTKGLRKVPQSNIPLVNLNASLGITYWGNEGGDTQTDVYRYDPVRFPDALYSSQGSPSQLDKISVFKEPLLGTGWSYQVSVFSIDDSFFNLVGWQVIGKSKGLRTSNPIE